jgi:hypothetical protein
VATTGCELKESGLKMTRTKDVGLCRVGSSNMGATSHMGLQSTCNVASLNGNMLCQIHTSFEDLVHKRM